MPSAVLKTRGLEYGLLIGQQARAGCVMKGRPQQQEYDDMSVKHVCERREQPIAASSRASSLSSPANAIASLILSP